MQHRQWSPAEAAEFAAARLTLTLRMLADDPKARLGMHRAAGIARIQGYGEVSASGLKFSELLTAQKDPAVRVEPLQREQHRAQEHDGVEYDSSHIEGEHAQSKRRSRKPRKRSAARKAKEHEKLEAKWRARRESEQQGTEPQPALQDAPRPHGRRVAAQDNRMVREQVGLVAHALLLLFDHRAVLRREDVRQRAEEQLVD